jgi:hypothetical protein
LQFFCPLSCKLYPWVPFGMQAWWTWNALACPCLGRSVFLHRGWRTALLDEVFLSGSYSLRPWTNLLHSFLAFCTDRSEVILTCLLLYGNWCFSLVDFNILSLISSFGFLFYFS